MSEQREKILQMLSEGKISVEEASRLLDAVGGSAPNSSGEQTSEKDKNGKSKSPNYIVIKVLPKTPSGDKVDIRIPMALLKAGVKMSSLLPEHARDRIHTKLQGKGIDIDMKDINSGNIESILNALTETSIDIDETDEKVKIYCE